MPIPRLIKEGLKRSVATMNRCVEKALLKGEDLRYPPVFIIGPPRSGTTLLYQLMVHHFKVAYFNTLANQFFVAPWVASAVSKPFLRPYRSDFKSYYGKIAGLGSPHEGGSIWNRWFPREHREGYNYVGSAYLSPDQKTEIRRLVAGMERVFSAPFLNKNVKNSVRIHALVDLFPQSLFLQMRRDPVHTALSILEGRKRLGEHLNRWLSVMPRQVKETEGKDYAQQIAEQLFYVEENVAEDRKKMGEDRFHTVFYRDLCWNPRREMEKIETFFASKGVSLEKLNEVPDSFPFRERRGSSYSSEQRNLVEKVKEMYSSRGGNAG